MLSSLKGRARDAAAGALAGFSKNGKPEADISETMNRIELDLVQTRRNLHRLRISGHEWKAIEPGLREVYRQCRKRMERAIGQGDDEAFYKWRMRVKNFYYELQLLQSVWPARLNKMVAVLGKLQDEIGADHDLVVLKNCCIGVLTLLAAPKAWSKS